MFSVKIRKIGNSLGLLIPKEVQKELNVFEGDLLDLIGVGKGELLLKNHLPHHSEWVFEGDTTLTAEDEEWLEADLLDEDDRVSKW